MRSLGTIRVRVERLASVCLPSPEMLFLHWVHRYERCPGCAADLAAHARETALAAALARQTPGDPPPSMVFFSTDALLTCPFCGAALPDTLPDNRTGSSAPRAAP